MAFARSGEGKGPFRNEWPASGAYQPVGGEDPLQRARMHPLAARALNISLACQPAADRLGKPVGFGQPDLAQ